MPSLPLFNRFDALYVEPEYSSDSDIESNPPDTSTVKPPPQPRIRLRKRIHQLLRKQFPERLEISSITPGKRKLEIQVELQSTDTFVKLATPALLDTGAMGLFIDKDYVEKNRLPTMKRS